MKRSHNIILLLLCLTIVLLLLPEQSSSTHFAFGTWTWSLSGSVYSIELTQAWRWSAWWPDSRAFTAGMTGQTSNLYYSPKIGKKRDHNTILTVQSKNKDSLTTGDYWWFGLLDFTLSTGVNSPQYLYFLNCCRISTLLENNHDQNDKHSVSISVTDKDRKSGLYCTGFPRESLEASSSTKSNDWDYSTPCVEPLSYSITYAISPGYHDSSTWTSELPRPTPCGTLSTTLAWNAACPNGLTYGSDGVAHWEPINKGGYAFSVTMTSGGNSNVWVQLDFVILVVAECDSTDTTCNHAPYFVNPPANWIVDCTATVPAEHTFNVADQDYGQTLELQNSPIPSGFSLSTSTVAGTSSSGPTGAFVIGWNPSIDSIDVVLCIKAVDNEGLSTQGTTCPDFTVVKPDYLYASGTVRVWQSDEASAYLFDSSTALQGNPVSSALDTTTRKPVWQTNPSVSSTIFNQWWSDEATTSLYDIYLYTAILIRYWNNAQDSSGVERVYSYRNTTFWVGDYVSDSTIGTNPYFSYEIHTSFDYLGTETLNFASAGGEMWVFMNNELMLSHWSSLNVVNSTITHSQMASAGLTAGDSYNIDIFYTHRSPNVNPVWQVEWANSTKCSAITLLAQSGTNIPYNINFNGNFSTDNIVRSSNVAISNGYLQLLSDSQSATSSSAWFALTDSGTTTSNLLKINSGFQTTFTFNMAKKKGTVNMDGLAFVLQAQSPTARGGDGASLGYSGLYNSIAIEFDALYSPAYDNTATDQHISLHTYYSGMNSAVESSKYWPLGTQPTMDLSQLPFTFDNGTDHVIRIEYLPGSVYSWLYVYVNDNILPLYTAQLDSTEMGTMFANGAYVGFTAGTSDTDAAGTVLIKDWKLLLIPPDAGYTGPTPDGTTSWSAVAGTEVTVDVQLRDACDQNLLVNGETSLFSASLQYKYSSAADAIIPVTIADAGDGVYTFSGLPTKTDTYVLKINLTTLAGESYIDNQPSGFEITVIPSDNVAANSYFTFSSLTPGLNNVANASLFTQVSNAGIACASFNTTGEPTQIGSQFASVAAFNTWAASEAMIACAYYGDATTATVGNAIYQAAGGSSNIIGSTTSLAFVASRASSSASWALHASASSDEEMVSLSDEVTNTAGDVYVYIESASKTRDQRAMILIAPSYLSVPSESTGGFWIMPRDQYNNYVISTSNSITYSFSPGLGASTDPVQCTNYISGSPALWCQFSTGASGSYLVSVLTLNVPVPQMGRSSAAAGTVLVTAGAASYLTSQQSGMTITTSVDVPTIFTVTLYDATGNRVLTQDGIHEITGIDFVSTTTNDVVFSLSDYTTQIVWQQSDEMYHINYTSTAAGQFYVKIYINGVEMVSSQGLTVAINPGVPSSLSYVVEDDESDGSFNTAPSAGVTISYSIYARDKYKNLCTNSVAGYTFTVAVTGTDAPATSAITVTSLGSGRYRFSLTPTQIVPWTVTVKLTDPDNNLVVIQKNSAATADATWTFTPIAGAIAQYSTFSLQCDNTACSTTAAATTFIAGSKNIPFSLALYDQYNNPITASQTAATIDAALSLSLQTDTSDTSSYALILSFDSVTQSSSNVYTGTITATVAANYTLSLKLASNGESLQLAQKTTDGAVAVIVSPAATDIPSVQIQSAFPSSVANNYATVLSVIDVDIYGNLRPVGSQNFSIATSGLNAYDTSAVCVGTTTQATYHCTLTLSDEVPTGPFVLTTTANDAVSSNGDSFTTDMTVYQGVGVLYARVESVVIRGVTYSMLNSSNGAEYDLPSFYSGESVLINVYAYSSASYTGQQSLSSAPSLTLAPANSAFTSTTVSGVDIDGKSLYAFNMTFKTISLNYDFDIQLNSIKSLVNTNNDYSITVVPGDLSAIRSSYASGNSFTHIAGDTVKITISPYDVNGNAIVNASSLVTYDSSTSVVSGIASIISGSHPLFECAWVSTNATILCTLESQTAAGQIDSSLYASLFQKVGTFSIGLTYSNAIVASRYITMTTTFAALDLTQSYISLNTIKPVSTSVTNFINVPYTGSSSSNIYLIAYDSYQNAITALSGLSSSLVIQASNSSILASTTCSWGTVTGYTNVYSKCIEFDWISRLGVTLNFEDANGVSPSVVAYVRSGIPAARTSTSATTPYVPSKFGLYYPNNTAVPSTSSYKIGSAFDFVLTAIDSNGLPFLYDLTSSAGDQLNAKISMYMMNSANQQTNFVTASVTSFNITNPGVWDFALDSSALTVVGDYYLDVSVSYGTTTVSIALYEFQIQAGEPYLPRTTLTIPTVVIGQTNAAFTFQLFDASGNLITSDPGDLIVSIRNNTVQSCTDWHSSDIDNSYPILDSSTIILGALSLDTTTGVWTQYVTPVITGSFTFYIALGDASSSLACSQLVNTAFTVHTGLTDARKSYYTISSSSSLPSIVDPSTSLTSIHVGTTYYVYIQLCDTQGNHISDNDLDSDDIFAFTDGNDEPTEEEGLANGTSVDITQLLDYQSIGYSNGIWRYAFVPQKTYTNAEFALYLNQSSLLSDSSSPHVITRINGTYNDIQAPQTIPVLHAAPVTIAFENLPTVLNYTAGQDLSFVLHAFDSLGNFVDDNSLHYVTATVNRDGSVMASGGQALGSYYFAPSSPTSSGGISTMSFTIAWEGSYEINVIMYNRATAAYINEATITILVNPASCADQYLSNHPNATASEIPQYRCASTNECVLSYANCSAAVDQTTCATGYTRCSATSTECVPFTSCSSSTVQCDDGSYVSTESECAIISPCPSGQVQCPNNAAQCRSTIDDCPSDVVCSPGLVVCPNQLTCATSVATCPVIPESVYTACDATFTNGVVCPDATCVASSSDCSTGVTCPSGQVLCLTDNSCRANATVCPSTQQYSDIENTTSCATNNQILCWDSSCAADYASCPSRMTCPVGDVLCSDGQCQASLADCYEEASLSNELESSSTSLACTVNDFRCDDGTCVSNKVLCPTIATCGSATPVLCSDLSCQSSLALCTIPSTCDDAAPIRCPSSGQCVTSLDYCTSTKTCPDSTPVLCASTRTCVASASDCAASSSCPAAFPYTCASSGSCRAAIADCPTTFSCPSSTPVQCPDGSCQVDLPLCVSTSTDEDSSSSSSSSSSSTTTTVSTECPSDHLMCPSGNCIPASMTLLGCPTQVTCPTGSLRCSDGTCRSSCSNVATSSCSAQGLIACPVVGYGQACAASLVACPRGVTCPLDAPVKCFDASCAATLDSCPSLPTSNPPSTKIPCPDGSWAYDTCPTAVTCPDNKPFTCYDQTCKVSLDQCPDPTPCDPTSDTPYRCTTGACAATPWDCGSIDGTVCDSGSLLVKCPLYDGTAQCVATASACPNTTTTTTTDDDSTSSAPTADEIYTSTCPAGYYYCRDGSCVETSTSCPTYSCPLSYPYLCEDGSCALNATQCPASNGCPWDTPTKCPGVGTCVALLRNCPAPTCSSSELPCPDGSCAASCQYAASGCLTSQVRCADGSCVDTYDTCTSQANTDYANSCPPGTPYECSTGLCVALQSECPTLDSAAACTSLDKPVLCADGICRASTDLCPIVKTCETDTVRCDDGSCRSSSDLCPTASTCPSGEFRCKQSDFTSVNILDGICSNNGLCYAANGCQLFNSISSPTRCDNGRCVSDSSLCEANVRLANGCVANATWTDPVKCWNGACAQNAGDCAATNGCPAATPFRCANGDCIADSTSCPTIVVNATTGETEQESCQGITCADGSCVEEGDESLCQTSFGCPVTTPFRCADGTCKKYSAAYRAPKYGLTATEINEWTCKPTIYCTSDSYTMCEDGQCVLSTSQCSSVTYSCNSTQVRCLDNTCADSYAHCDMVEETDSDGEIVTDGQGNSVWIGSSASVSSCPSSAPAMCTDGSCVSSMADCSTSTNPSSTTITGSSSASKKNSSSTIAQVLCFDGSYRDSFAECIAFAKQIYNDTTSSDSSSASSADGTVCTTYCSDGTCVHSDVSASSVCAPVPACSAGYYRCYDGTCRTTCQDTSTNTDIAPVVCDDDQELCIDGVCRLSGECPQYAGCGFEESYRYQCPSRECASGPDGCTAAANRNADSYALLLLADAQRDEAQATSDVTPIETTSLIAQPNSVISSFTLAATTTSYKSCSSNCLATQSIYDTSVAYDPTRDQSSYIIAPLATAFTVTLSSGLTVNTSLDSNIYFSPVAQSVYYNASNKVTYSRVDDFDGSTTFTAAQTVLSPVFSCSAGSGITEPFSVNVAISSLFDRSGSQKAAPADVCLARLRRYPEHNYATWECLFNDTLRSSGNTQYSIRQSSTAALNQASSYITTCIDSDLSVVNASSVMTTQATDSIVPAVYAFIHSPVQTGQVYADPAVSWFDGNVIWIMIVAILAVLGLFALVYAVSRLSRYKNKTEQVKEEIQVMEREVDDLENYGGRRYDGGEVAYTANPMAQSLEAQQELQKMTDADRLQLQKENLAKQQAESVERQEMIQQLEDANAQELAMLEATRAKLQQNQRRRVD